MRAVLLMVANPRCIVAIAHNTTDCTVREYRNDIQVRVVQHKQTKALYALKYINKQVCITIFCSNLGRAVPAQLNTDALCVSAGSAASSNMLCTTSFKNVDYSKRSSVRSFAIFDTHSRMTKIYSWFSISCSEEICDFI